MKKLLTLFAFALVTFTANAQDYLLFDCQRFDKFNDVYEAKETTFKKTGVLEINKGSTDLYLCLNYYKNGNDSYKDLNHRSPDMCMVGEDFSDLKKSFSEKWNICIISGGNSELSFWLLDHNTFILQRRFYGDKGWVTTDIFRIPIEKHDILYSFLNQNITNGSF